MAWIRWDVTTPQHPLIGRLAGELGIRRAEAHGLYVATCCGFGQHQVDGLAEGLPAAVLEGWADWQGKPGKWAAAFQRLCVEREEGESDPVGGVHGWWRNAAVLREQERSRKRPGQGSRKAAATATAQERPPEGTEKAPRGPAVANPVPPRGNDDDDGNENERPNSQSVDPDAEPVAASAEGARLIAAFVARPDRWAVYRFLERCPEKEQLSWAQRLAGYLQGLGFPAGMAPTPAQVATACSDYSQVPPNPVHFRAFILRLMQGGKPRSGPRTPPPIEDQLEAAHRWAARGD
jgi:hypothetical protein